MKKLMMMAAAMATCALLITQPVMASPVHRMHHVRHHHHHGHHGHHHHVKNTPTPVKA